MSQNIKIKLSEGGDIDLLIAQGIAPFDKDYWSWVTGFRPDQQILLLAYFNDKIIGYFATIMSSLKVGEQIINSYHGDLFIHPDYRKKNYSFFTLNSLLKKMKQEIVEKNGVLYGFPIQRLAPLYKRAINARYLKRIPRFVCALRIVLIFEHIFRSKKFSNYFACICQPLWKSWLSRKRFLSRDISIKEIRFFDERFNSFWKKVSQTRDIILSRNAEYLNWRYLKEPGVQYVIYAAEKNNEILGYIVLKSLDKNNQRRGQIIDLLDIQDKALTKALLLQAIDYFVMNSADQIEFFVSDNYYEQLLHSMGFLKRRSRLWADDHLMSPCLSKSIDENYYYNADRWFITTADMLLA